MSESPYIVELNPDNFQQIVLSADNNTPVLVDFWADWCQPCKTLMPLLSRLAEEYQGKFILAKLNTEQHQELAQQFGIRSLPTVKLFRAGEPVDEFTGALPEAEVRAFLDKHLPRESDQVIETAQQHLLQGDTDTALVMLYRAIDIDPDNHRATIALAQALAATEKPEDALALLDDLPADKQEEADVKSLRSHLHFEALAAQDGNVPLQMAAQQVVEQDYSAALESLLEMLKQKQDAGDQVAQKNMLKIFDILGNDPLVAHYRNQMLNFIY